ncbi:MAG: DUF1292 domain-containing protein [Lachnospiraceae bacterium]|jgi:uncharacterized protein YrzB (UPF0473 family)|nr:DUF1292 domain-containing protein [Lachnospiraceae bacterium]
MADKKKDKKIDTVTLELENGEEMTCDVISIFPVNVNNKEQMYIALLDENADEDSDIFFYRASNLEDPDDIQLDDIESDEEFEIVADAFDEMLDDEELNEMLDDLEDDEEE